MILTISFLCSFCQMHSCNFGIAGDRTETLLWRLQEGELDGLAPKVSYFFYSTSHNDHKQPLLIEVI